MNEPLTARCTSRNFSSSHWNAPGIWLVLLSNGQSWSTRGRNASRREEIAITQWTEWSTSKRRLSDVK